MAKFEEKVKLREQGMTYAQIADKLGISRQAVGQALSKYNPKQFRPVKETSCIYKGLREWMNKNKVSVAELTRRVNLVPCASANIRVAGKLNGRNELSKRTIDKVLEITGLTYEQAFGNAEPTIFEKVVRCKDCNKGIVCCRKDFEGNDYHEVFCGLMAAYMAMNNFCSYGERKNTDA